MSGAHCKNFPACMEVTNNATVPTCDKPDCPGKRTWADAGFLFHAHAPDACKHRWDGPVVEIENGESVTCSKCGMDAFSYSLATAP